MHFVTDSESKKYLFLILISVRMLKHAELLSDLLFSLNNNIQKITKAECEELFAALKKIIHLINNFFIFIEGRISI